MVAYGNILELYEYESNIALGTKRRRKNESGAWRRSMVVDGQNTSTISGVEKYERRKDNAKRVALVFGRLVSANLGGDVNPILITLTYAENITDIKRGYRDFRSFVQALRYKFGNSFKYISVPEFQKRGAVHFHALFWGLSPILFERERDTRFFAKLWGQGFLYWKYTDGNLRLATYLKKYMAKAFLDIRLKNQKAYTASRNVIRPVCQGGFSPVWPVLDEWGVDSNAVVLSSEYDTIWLGRCKKRIYQLSKKQNEV